MAQRMNGGLGRWVRAGVGAGLVAAGAGLGGCLISSDRESWTSGAVVEPERLLGVQPGVTTSEEVQRTLGTPTSRSVQSDGSERWVYRWTTVREERGSVFLVFGGRSKDSVTEEVAITFRDGVVTNVERF